MKSFVRCTCYCIISFFVNTIVNTSYGQLNVFAELTGNPVVTTGWNLTNQATVVNDEIVLSPNLNDKSGTIFYMTPIDFSNGGRFVVDFEFRMYDGTAADGIALNVITQLPDGSPQGGGGMGVAASSTGLKIVFDTYDNCSQNDNPEIQVFNGTGYAECGIPATHRLKYQSYLRSSTYQPARFVYDNGTVDIYINCELKLTVPNVTIQNSGYFGFSAATGGATDRHSIKSVKIYATTPSIGVKNICSGVQHGIGVNSQSGNTYLWEPVSLSDNTAFLDDVNSSNPIFQMTNDGDTTAVQKYVLTTTLNSNPTCPIVITDTVHVNVYPSLSVEKINTKLVCNTNTVTATAIVKGGKMPHTYEWTKETMSVPLDTGLQITNLESGTYLFTFSDDNNCKDSVEFEVNIPDKIDVTLKASDTVLCRGDSTLITLNYTGGAQPISIFGADDSLITDSSFWTAPIYDSTYVVVAIDSNQCSDTAKIAIKSIPLPIANFESPYLNGCIPFTTQLNNLSMGSFSSCLYTLSDGRQFSACNSTNEVITFITPGCYDVTLTVSTPEGCSDTIVHYNYLCAFPNPIAKFNVSSHDLNSDDRTVFTENLSIGAESYFWDFGDNSPTYEQFAPSHIYPGDHVGTYVISLLVISDKGCADTTTQLVHMQDVQQIYVPNTFSPNNDSYNDLFLPIITSEHELLSYRLEIYDRWGEIVFETEDINQPWNGQLQGINVPDGLYVWKIFIEGRNFVERKTYLGHVYVIR